MATRNGSYQNRARIEWVYSVGSVGPNTTSVSVQVTAYLRMQSGYSINGNWPVNWWGSWGTSSNTQSISLGGGQRKQIRSWSQTVSLTDSSQSRSLAIRVQHYWGATEDTLNFSIPARYARTPSNVQVNRLSDSNVRVAWTRNSTYTSVVVQRRVNEGSWQTAAVAQGNAQNITLTDGRVNRRYQFRVQGRGGSGNSGYSAASAYVYTTPVAPTGIAAERSGSGISVSVDNTTPWATRFDVEDSVGGIVATDQPLSALPYLHTSPDPAQPHRYRVRMRVYSGGNEAAWLVGPWSEWSNTVQLIQPPSAPTNLTPNGAIVDLAKNVTFSWRHNSVDSSAQEAAQVRYRKTGTSTWTTRTITGSTQQRVESLSAIGAGTVEWQVRTKGAHATYSPWSALATLTLIDAPTVAILQPESIHRSITVTVQWSYAQQQSRPQSSWQVQLTNADTGALVESRSGSGSLSSLRLNARLEPDTNYIARVRAATGAVWSEWAEMPFVTEFVPPREPIVDGEWNEETGSYDLTIEDADCTDDGILYQNLVTNPRMQTVTGSMVEVRRNLCKNPSFETGTHGVISGSATTVIDTGFAAGVYSGSRCLMTTVTGATTSNGYIAQDVASVPGEWLAWSLSVRGSTGPRYVRLFASFPGTSIENIWLTEYILLSSGPPITEIPRIVASLQVPAGATTTRLWVRLYHDTAGNPPQDGNTLYDAWLVASDPDQNHALEKVSEYFDGDTLPADVNPDDLSVRWLGTPGNSESVLEGQRVASLGSASTSWTLHPYQVDDGAGGKAARFAVVTSGASRIPISEYGGQLTPGASHTMKFRVRSSDALTNLSPRIQNQTGAPLVEIPANEWVDIQVTQPAGTSTWSNTGFYLNSGSGQQPGTLIDIANAMLIPVAAGEEYTGPYHDGDDVGWGWDGEPHASSSTELERPASTSVVIERSVDEGSTWEHVIEASFEDCTLSVSDFEGLSCGTTLYRVTNSAATGASIDVVHEGLADSEAIWLSTGEGFAQTARISIHDGVGISRGRERSLEHYQGRSLGVAYMSENLQRTVSVQGMVPDTDMLRCPSVTRDELERIITYPYPVHLHRDMHGNRIYGIAGNIGLDREWLMAHRDCGEHQGLCGLGLWAFKYDLDETEGR